MVKKNKKDSKKNKFQFVDESLQEKKPKKKKEKVVSNKVKEEKKEIPPVVEDLDEKVEIIDEVLEEEVLEEDTLNPSVEEVVSEKESVKISPIQKEKVEKEEPLHDTSYDKPLKKPPYLGFEARVILSSVLILVMFVGACLLSLKAIQHSRVEYISFKEKKEVFYKVCSKINCYDESLEYGSERTDIIKSHFQYHAEFPRKVNYTLEYNIKAFLKIYDSKKEVIYKLDDTLNTVKKDLIVTNEVSFEEDVAVVFHKYYDSYMNYKNSHPNQEMTGDLEIVLYLEGENGPRKIANLVIPMGVDFYKIVKNTVSDSKGKVAVSSDTWNQQSIICAVFSLLLIVGSFYFLYKTVKMVRKVSVEHSIYREKLLKILREYDRIIVIARGGYESNLEREVVKVDSFDELLEVKKSLQKPIIYSKVNDVKSEFIVEDEDKLYKYTLKEADV